MVLGYGQLCSMKSTSPEPRAVILHQHSSVHSRPSLCHGIKTSEKFGEERKRDKFVEKKVNVRFP